MADFNTFNSKITDSPLTLPPNTSSEKFTQFLARAAQIVDEHNVTVISRPEQFQQEEYMSPSRAHDMFHILDKAHFLASAVVAPKNVPEVQEFIRLVNEFEIPVWPFSMGRNVGYGGAAPRVPGSIALDMGRHLNKVLEVNADSAYALVEPGVSFFDLHDYIMKHNLRDKVWADVPDLGGGSVIGNTLERGVGYTPYGDHW
jgi:FAD/FMN-containing dehydrogenase